MAKKDLRAQMEAARAAAAFIGAAQEAEGAKPEPSNHPDVELSIVGSEREEGALLGASSKEAAETVDGTETDVDVQEVADAPVAAKATASGNRTGKRAPRQVKSAASDVTLPAAVPDFFADAMMGEGGVVAAQSQDVGQGVSADPASLGEGAIVESAEVTVSEPAAVPAKPKRARKPRKKAVEIEEAAEPGSNRMTAQVLVPMTAEQREHADLLAQVKKITRAEVMRQALDEYWDNHKSELQQAVAAYEQLIRKLMK